MKGENEEIAEKEMGTLLGEPTFAEVLLPLPLPNTYTYEVPAEMAIDLKRGMLAEVQFGRQKLYTALVVRMHSRKPEGYTPKPILGILGDTPVLNDQQFQLWKWIAEYYLCTQGDVMNAALPAPYRLNSETRVVMRADFNGDYTHLADREYLIAEALSLQNELSVGEIQAILQRKRVQYIVRALIEKGVAVLREELKPEYKVKTRKLVALSPELQDNEDAVRQAFDQLERAPKQLELLMRWHEIIGKEATEENSVPKSILLKRAGASHGTFNALVKKNIFVEIETAISRLGELQEKTSEPQLPTLSPAQSTAAEQLLANFEQHNTVLLHGVTSSGKTEIYMQLIGSLLGAETADQPKQVLYLLPEIALTAQIVNRFKAVFGDEVGVYHSKFNQNERVEIWQHVASGKYRILIGPRSALFLPFKNLGLIIVDEEHDSSYKQFDPAPRYHARDAAIYLASLYGAKTLLGTATPSLESLHNAQIGKYGHVSLKERFGGIALPAIELIDMKEQAHKKRLKGSFSDRLIEEIGAALENNKQVILFRNRRGYAPYLTCESCGWVPQCDNCDISLTYHKYHEQLRCHLCGFHRPPPASCPACAAKRLSYEGYGTEKVESELALYFPEATIGRMDLDSVKGKTGHEKLIDRFESQEIDILVGTQMVTKGLDFGNVSLVGILSADQLIYFPDFRAHERAFQLMEQVSGRAGRKGGQGKVLIQARDVQHPILKLLVDHDFDSFTAAELHQRKKWHYPPYVRLIKLTIRHRYAETSQAAARMLAGWLRDALGARVLGPAQPGVARVRNQYIFEIQIKLEKDKQKLRLARNAIRNATDKLYQRKPYKGVSIQPNMDPY